MKLHEYQAKELFRRHGITVPQGGVATTVDEAVAVAQGLASYPQAIKAQVQAGGRGKGGGVRLVHSEEELRAAVGDLLGMQLVTAQSGPGGVTVRKVLVEQGERIAKECYLALLVDRVTASILIMASGRGGTEIEELARTEPEAVAMVRVNPLLGLRGYHLRELAAALALPAEAGPALAPLVRALYGLFVEHDCTLVEINPLVVTEDHRLVALDAKVEIDGNALSRQKELAGWRDDSEVDPLELQAKAAGLNYIKLTGGSIGTMVNGAGLAMASMDLIGQAGAKPANFLDVGGGASAAAIASGLRILLGDPEVKVLFINIFGGILRCDLLAQGLVTAAGEVAITVPVVVRLAGTNAEEGRKILADAGLDWQPVTDLAEAVKQLKVTVGEER